MAKFDAEVLLSSLRTLIEANLNTKIAEITAEKDILLGASNFTLPPIPADAFFDQLDEKVQNVNPFVYYGVGVDNFVINEGASAEDIKIFFTVVLHNSHEDDKIYLKMLRYIRALKEIVDSNFDKFSSTSGLEIEAMNPRDVADLDTSEPHKIGGIIITTIIA